MPTQLESRWIRDALNEVDHQIASVDRRSTPRSLGPEQRWRDSSASRKCCMNISESSSGQILRIGERSSECAVLCSTTVFLKGSVSYLPAALRFKCALTGCPCLPCGLLCSWLSRWGSLAISFCQMREQHARFSMQSMRASASSFRHRSYPRWFQTLELVHSGLGTLETGTTTTTTTMTATPVDVIASPD
jgi:hypothetical protein